jgi:hypothetical protein
MKGTVSVTAIALSVVAGAVLVFLAFAAVFNGVWPALIAVALSYGVAAAGAVKLGKAPPIVVAGALVCPALPGLIWLVPAAIREVGLLRSLLWPVAVAAIFLIAWFGGALAARVSRDRET